MITIISRVNPTSGLSISSQGFIFPEVFKDIILYKINLNQNKLLLTGQDPI